MSAAAGVAPTASSAAAADPAEDANAAGLAAVQDAAQHAAAEVAANTADDDWPDPQVHTHVLHGVTYCRMHTTSFSWLACRVWVTTLQQVMHLESVPRCRHSDLIFTAPAMACQFVQRLTRCRVIRPSFTFKSKINLG